MKEKIIVRAEAIAVVVVVVEIGINHLIHLKFRAEKVL